MEWKTSYVQHSVTLEMTVPRWCHYPRDVPIFRVFLSSATDTKHKVCLFAGRSTCVSHTVQRKNKNTWARHSNLSAEQHMIVVQQLAKHARTLTGNGGAPVSVMLTVNR